MQESDDARSGATDAVGSLDAMYGRGKQGGFPAGDDEWHAAVGFEGEAGMADPSLMLSGAGAWDEEIEQYACAPSLKERRLLLNGALDVVSKEASKIRLFA